MGKKHLKCSSTLRDARYKLAMHLFSASGHSSKFQGWEVCLQTAASEFYIKYTYDHETGSWSNPEDKPRQRFLPRQGATTSMASQPRQRGWWSGNGGRGHGQVRRSGAVSASDPCGQLQLATSEPCGINSATACRQAKKHAEARRSTQTHEVGCFS